MIRRIAKTIIIALVYLAAWELASLAVGKPLLFPSPVDTAKALFTLACTGRFYQTIGMTLLRVLLGFSAGMAAGFALGVLTAFCPLADSFLAPLRSIVRATPVTSFVILVLLWLSGGLTPVFIAFLTVMPIAWTNVRAGMRSTDEQLVEMTQAFNMPPLRRFTKLYVPGAMPQIVAASTTGLGFAWKSGVAAEVIANTRFSIGRSLIESKLYVEVPELFAWTASVVALSILLEKLMLMALRRYTNAKA